MQSGPIYLPLTRGKAPADIGRFHSLLEVHTIMINAKTGSTELTFGLGKSGRIWPLYTHRQSNSNYTAPHGSPPSVSSSFKDEFCSSVNYLLQTDQNRVARNRIYDQILCLRVAVCPVILIPQRERFKSTHSFPLVDYYDAGYNCLRMQHVKNFSFEKLWDRVNNELKFE